MKYPINFDIELKKNPYKGLYIALEGIDGSGKSTQAEALGEYFTKQGKKIFKTHEPRREGVVGKLIHDVLQSDIVLPAVSLQYLFAADRQIHQEQMVIPALKEGKIVISDRSFWSSIPYGLLDKSEMGKKEVGDQLLSSLSILSMYHEFVAPDIAIVLDVSVEVAGQRFASMGRKAELYEKKEKLMKVKEGYDFLLSKFPESLIKLNAEKPVEKVTSQILLKIVDLNR